MNQNLIKYRSNQIFRSILLKLNIDKFGNEISIEWDDATCKYIVEIGHSPDPYWCKFEIRLIDWINMIVTIVGVAKCSCRFQNGNRDTYDYIHTEFIKECYKVLRITKNLSWSLSEWKGSFGWSYYNEYIYEDAV